VNLLRLIILTKTNFQCFTFISPRPKRFALFLQSTHRQKYSPSLHVSSSPDEISCFFLSHRPKFPPAIAGDGSQRARQPGKGPQFPLLPEKLIGGVKLCLPKFNREFSRRFQCDLR
jgi:hypothetical protein